MGEVFGTRTQEVDVLNDIICDNCKKSCGTKYGIEAATISANWGYGTRKDGENHRGFLCEECYDWLLSRGFTPKIRRCYDWFDGLKEGA